MLKADDPNVIFVGNGDAIPGVTGTIQHSTDGGQSWEALQLPVEPNSVVYWFATHPSRPHVNAAASLYGYVYVSTDGVSPGRNCARSLGNQNPGPDAELTGLDIRAAAGCFYRWPAACSSRQRTLVINRVAELRPVA
jgi:hypothetical protein